MKRENYYLLESNREIHKFIVASTSIEGYRNRKFKEVDPMFEIRVFLDLEEDPRRNGRANFDNFLE